MILINFIINRIDLIDNLLLDWVTIRLYVYDDPTWECEVQGRSIHPILRQKINNFYPSFIYR